MKNLYRPGKRAVKRAAVLSAAFLLALGILSGCDGERSVSEQEEAYLLYVEQGSVSLVPVVWEPSEEEPRDMAQEALEEMKEPEDPEGYVSAIPEEVSVEVKDLQNGKLDLTFSDSYSSLSKKSEVLLRAAVVQSLTQIEGISRVRFFIGDQPLREADGTETGYMGADDFVCNIGSALNSYQKTDLTLYFAAADGNSLAQETVNVRYNSNTSLQKLILEQLLKGPQTQECQNTLPADTILLGVSVKDGICYVNFDEGFLSQDYQVSPELAVYSIVNSLVENGDGEIRAVQISVNGESDISFRNAVDLSHPLERNPDLVEETE